MNVKEIFMEFFIFKSQQVLSRESAIAMVTKILFLCGGEAAAQKKIAAESPTPRLPTPGQGIAQIIVST